MSKEKDRYYDMISQVKRQLYIPDSRVTDYVTELEKKAEMLYEAVNLLSQSENFETEWMFNQIQDFLDRAKKIQEAGE